MANGPSYFQWRQFGCLIICNSRAEFIWAPFSNRAQQNPVQSLPYDKWSHTQFCVSTLKKNGKNRRKIFDKINCKMYSTCKSYGKQGTYTCMKTQEHTCTPLFLKRSQERQDYLFAVYKFHVMNVFSNGCLVFFLFFYLLVVE